MFLGLPFRIPVVMRVVASQTGDEDWDPYIFLFSHILNDMGQYTPVIWPAMQKDDRLLPDDNFVLQRIKKTVMKYRIINGARKYDYQGRDSFFWVSKNTNPGFDQQYPPKWEPQLRWIANVIPGEITDAPICKLLASRIKSDGYSDDQIDYGIPYNVFLQIKTMIPIADMRTTDIVICKSSGKYDVLIPHRVNLYKLPEKQRQQIANAPNRQDVPESAYHKIRQMFSFTSTNTKFILKNFRSKILQVDRDCGSNFLKELEDGGS